MILTVYGDTKNPFYCSKAVKGIDYIKLYDESGQQVAGFGGISDFSGYSLTDDEGNPIEFSSPDPTLEDRLTASEIFSTDLDLATIENGIMITDLDLRLLELEVV